MSDQTNPNSVGGMNEYAGFVAPSRPDASIVGPGGNTVDRARINRSVTSVDKGNLSQAHPLGEPQNGG